MTEDQMARTAIGAVVVIVLACAAYPVAADRPSPAPAGGPASTTRPAGDRADPADPAARERWFADLLTNADLVGSFTTDGRDHPPKEDRYTILKAVKGDGDNWVITAKVGYKGIALPVDITVPVKWAGDTPVISMTDQRVPGMDTFTVRLMFYGTHYAGTWSAPDHGGLMWGRIEKAGANKPTTRPTTR
jgi:hypothetical protein